MKFSSYLNSDYIFPGIEASSKEEAIKLMLDKIAETENTIATRKEEVFISVMKRENEISTCMGDGIFIPHARIKDFDDFVIAVATLKNEIEGEIAATHEKDKIKLIFLIVSDVLKNKNILKTMSVISKLDLKHPEIVKKIKEETNNKIIYELLKSEDIEIEHRIVAEDVLSPDIRPVLESDTLEEVAKRLILEKRDAFPVVSKSGELLGEITEKELIAFGLPEHLSLLEDVNFLTVGEPFEEYLLNENTTTIENIYRRDIKPAVIDKQTPIMEICFKMVRKNFHRLYVIEDGKYCGLINRSDIIKKILHI